MSNICQTLEQEIKELQEIRNNLKKKKEEIKEILIKPIEEKLEELKEDQETAEKVLNAVIKK